MAKLYKVLPRGFFCLVAVLMVLSALAVPSRDARSDEPISECEDDTACPEGYLCVEGNCVLAPLSCQEGYCIFKDGTVGCTVNCAGMNCTGGPQGNGKCATDFQSKGCTCQ